MVRNNEVVSHFQYGGTRLKTKNLYIKEGKTGTALYNYATPIAFRTNMGKVYVGDKKYSPTTSTIQNQIDGEKVDVPKFKKILNDSELYNTGRL